MKESAIIVRLSRYLTAKTVCCRPQDAWIAVYHSVIGAVLLTILFRNGMIFFIKETGKVHMQRLAATNNFPEFTGRICPASCEHACVLNINNDPVTIRENEVAIVERAFAEGYIKPVIPEKQDRKKCCCDRKRSLRNGCCRSVKSGWP